MDVKIDQTRTPMKIFLRKYQICLGKIEGFKDSFLEFGIPKLRGMIDFFFFFQSSEYGRGFDPNWMKFTTKINRILLIKKFTPFEN